MKKFLQFVLSVLLIALVITSIGWYLLVYDRDFTRDVLLQQARFYDTTGNEKLSAWFYNLAYEHSGKDESVAIELANQYKSDGNYTKAEVVLSNAINADPSAVLYTALCKTYVEQDKLMDAIALLDSIPDPFIQAELNRMRPSAPEADIQPGFYSQYINVSLSSSSGMLAFTTTGEYPSVANEPYSAPIALAAGETVIYCISVDDNGLVSPLSILGYTIGGIIEPAVFEDVEMELTIRESLGLDWETTIMTDTLWEITEFTIPETVTNLSDLSLMPYLESLTAANLHLESLSDFSSLANLKTLDLSGSRFPVEDLAILAKLPALQELNISNCGISTIANLAEASNLTVLNFSGNTVRNLEALSEMEKLEELYMQRNALTSLEIVGLLPNLAKLDISYNSITTIRPLENCKKLTWLDASNNQIESAKGVAELPLLTTLSLSYNKLTKVQDIGSCIQLKELSISNNSISDISPLVTLVYMEVLDCSRNNIYHLPPMPDDCALRIIDGSNNAIDSVTPLKGLENLTFVSLDYNQLTTVDALASCNNLVQVNIYGNDVRDVSKLTAHNIIVNYDPT